MIVNPWPGFRHEDRPLVTYNPYLFCYCWRCRRIHIDATRLQWLYLTGAKFSDVYKRVLKVYEFILTVNIFVVSGLRVREPPEATTT